MGWLDWNSPTILGDDHSRVLCYMHLDIVHMSKYKNSIINMNWRGFSHATLGNTSGHLPDHHIGLCWSWGMHVDLSPIELSNDCNCNISCYQWTQAAFLSVAML